MFGKRQFAVFLIVLAVLIAGCTSSKTDTPQAAKQAIPEQKTPASSPSPSSPSPSPTYPSVKQLDKIPTDAIKMTKETDIYPPKLHSDEFEEPVPFEPITTAGAEDSPFISPDGNEFYFVFVPDVRLPVEKQLFDGASGIWVSKKSGGKWQTPERVWIQDYGKLSLDGCPFVSSDGSKLWFCSAREGYTGMHWFTADRAGDKWTNWQNADFSAEYEVGELHMSTDNKELYYHSSHAGGKGKQDIWMLENINEEWKNPVNIEIVNSPEDEGMPFLTKDGNELWFHRWYMGTPAVFRSKRVNGTWQEPEMIVSQFAGEPNIDDEGNLYFVHHYFNNSKMIEADIYVAKRK